MNHSDHVDLWWSELERLEKVLMCVGPDEVCCEGMTPRQTSILRTLIAREGARLMDLAAVSGITPSAMTRVIEKLEKQGMVRRVRGAREDGQLLAAQVEGKSIITIEGLGLTFDKPDEGPTHGWTGNVPLHTLQRAFVETGAIQCGYCTPAMILAAKSLLDRNLNPSETEVREILSGVLCRCTGYTKPVQAVLRAAAVMRGEEVEPIELRGEPLPVFNNQPPAQPSPESEGGSTIVKTTPMPTLAWIGILACLNVTAQTMCPSWMRARALSMYLLVLQGGMAVGSAAWGALASRYGVANALLCAAAVLVLGLLTVRRHRLTGRDLEFAPAVVRD